MNRHRQLAACTVVLLMTVMACPAFAQDVTLRYRWTKGDKVRYRFTQQISTATTGVPGFGDMTSDQTTTQTFSIVVDDVAADGSVILRQVFESVRIEVNTPMGKLAFDSDNKDAATGDPFGKFLAGVMPAMIGESVRMRLLPNGSVQSVEGMTRILDKMAAGLPQDRTAAAAFGMLKDGLSDEAMSGVLSQGFAQLPDQPVKIGDTWTRQFDVNNPLMGNGTISTTFKLDGVEKAGAFSIARIALKSTTKQTTAPSAPALGPLSVQLGDGSGDGEQLFDATNGRLQRVTQQITTPMTMSGPAPDGSQLSLRAITKSTMTMELLEK
jgi:Family of unknown function (DUF6263)